MNKTEPKHLLFEKELKEYVKKHKIVAHEKLPGEKQLREIFHYSVETIRKTLSRLEIQGFIYKRNGVGTFLAPKLEIKK